MDLKVIKSTAQIAHLVICGNEILNGTIKASNDSAVSEAYSIADDINERSPVVTTEFNQNSTLTSENNLSTNVSENEDFNISNITDSNRSLSDNWENELFVGSSTETEVKIDVLNSTMISEDTKIASELNSSTTDDKTVCITSADCEAGCICNQAGNCECNLKPTSILPSSNGDDEPKPLYESLNGYNKIRLFRPSEYKSVSHLKLSTLQQLGSTIGHRTGLSSRGTYLTRVGSGRLVGLPWNQMNTKYLTRRSK
uniref:DUF4335 domain-containing protein n=1 Tax=Syphacia muris TaxID=451379 RepID=A0A0N5ARV7_9BILA